MQVRKLVLIPCWPSQIHKTHRLKPVKKSFLSSTHKWLSGGCSADHFLSQILHRLWFYLFCFFTSLLQNLTTNKFKKKWMFIFFRGRLIQTSVVTYLSRGVAGCGGSWVYGSFTAVLLTSGILPAILQHSDKDPNEASCTVTTVKQRLRNKDVIIKMWCVWMCVFGCVQQMLTSWSSCFYSLFASCVFVLVEAHPPCHSSPLWHQLSITVTILDDQILNRFPSTDMQL